MFIDIKVFLLIGLVLLCMQSDVVYCACTQPESQSENCPPWFFFNTTTNKCECYSDPALKTMIRCEEQRTLLRFGYCTTYEEDQGLFLSRCHYFQANNYKIAEDKYIELPQNISELNDYMCGSINRKGRVCSECADGFGIPVFSLVPTCTKCTGAWYVLPLYLFLEFVPITIFYIIILCYKLNITSAPMVAFVFYCQTGVSTLYIISNRNVFDNSIEFKYLTILTTFYGFWNLDFFRYILPPFCISPYIKAFHLTYLFYVSALYPLCLTGIIGICIELYARNNRLFVWLWNKLGRLVFRRFSKRKDVHNTMIDVIATFFLLSYAKLIFIFVQTLLADTTISVHNSTMTSTYKVGSDPSVEYLSNEHLYFAIPSTFIFLVTIVPSTVLLISYPFKAFKIVLAKCHCSGRFITTINIFVDKFYSSYRNGLNGSRDTRWLISMYFFLRIFHTIASQFGVFYIISIVYVCWTALVATVRPYKKTNLNIIETLILANMTLIAILADQRIGQDNPRQLKIVNEVATATLSTLPLAVLIGYIIYKCVLYLRKNKKIISKFMSCKRKKNTNKENLGQRNRASTELPDRVLHPELYGGNTCVNLNAQPNVGSV